MRYDMYVLKDGTPCSMHEYAEKHTNTEYSRIALTYLDSAEEEYVSTVWLGINHNGGMGPPIIFETMAFYEGDWRECRRYRTEDEAKQGHAEVLEEVLAKRPKKVTAELVVPEVRYHRSLDTE